MHLRTLLPVLGLLCSTAVAHAVTICGLTTSHQLLKFDSTNPSAAIPITIDTISVPGIVDIDFHPRSGLLYGTTANGHAYNLKLDTAQTSQIGHGIYSMTSDDPSAREGGGGVSLPTDAALLVFGRGLGVWKMAMRKTSLALAALCVFLVGCASEQRSSDSRTRSVHAAYKDPRFIQPRVGMTKEEVRAAYGEPDSILHTSKGEIWRYWFNRGATIWLGSRPRLASLLFSEHGTVKEYLWNE